MKKEYTQLLMRRLFKDWYEHELRELCLALSNNDPENALYSVIAHRALESKIYETDQLGRR